MLQKLLCSASNKWKPNDWFILTHCLQCLNKPFRDGLLLRWLMFIDIMTVKALHLQIFFTLGCWLSIIISLIPRLSHRLSYVTFQTISWSWNSSPTNTWLPMRCASVYIIHMNPMCAAQSAARSTVKLELGQWILGARDWSVILTW